MPSSQPSVAADDDGENDAGEGEEEEEEEKVEVPFNIYEDEDVTYSQRSKLYRFRGGEWKERGLGDARLLKHKTTERVRFLFRQEKTLKIVANFYVIDSAGCCELKPHLGNDKCWFWQALDYSEEEYIVEKFALRFGSPEKAQEFKAAFIEAREQNTKLGLGQTTGDSKTEDAGAAAVEQVSDALASSKLEEPATNGTSAAKEAELAALRSVRLQGGSVEYFVPGVFVLASFMFLLLAVRTARKESAVCRRGGSGQPLL
eukprot:gnl/TRDRNA2_/TRDRNA2_157421_c0_seq2.p1 gnl/TRDRNA2_/TRDRNA2_157421_c0~~gnl/TRDRNA2_/TRDRNA2_157421_c0_seq2.p1  ORF type:complete len:259 (+),score=55.80 gnl/TRDRNA2_/TRDRNA2_157421_c0_seq2:49-825(+)